MQMRYLAATVVALGTTIGPAAAQLPGGLGGGAAARNQISSQTQQRVQAQAQEQARQQAQEQAQAQIHQQVQAQAQEQMRQQIQAQTQQQIQAQTQQQIQAQARQQAQQQMQSQVQSQVQSTVRQQVQSQLNANVQTQVRAQAQTRVQAEAARAVNIAERASVAARQNAAAARGQATAAAARLGGLQVGVGARASTNARANVAGHSTNAHARLGLRTDLSLPADVTPADVQVYDNIFGRFNPLRAEARQTSESAVVAISELDAGDRPDADFGAGAASAIRLAGAGRAANGDAGATLSSRIAVAARQRRAEISEVRDRAMAEGSTELMLRAQRMEDYLNAFAAAQAQVRSQGSAGNRPAPTASESGARFGGRSTTDVRGTAGGDGGGLSASGSSRTSVSGNADLGRPAGR